MPSKKIIDPAIKAEVERYDDLLRYSIDALRGKIQSAFTTSKLLTILPEESKEYNFAKVDLETKKKTIALEMKNYDKYRTKLISFCENKLYYCKPISAYDLALQIIEEMND